MNAYQVATKTNTPFMAWWESSLAQFDARNLRQPLYGEAQDAYQMGESPETFAAYAAGIDNWNSREA
jgi:hypothetical protein